MSEQQQNDSSMHQKMAVSAYLKLGIVLALSLIAMYFLTFALIHVGGDFYFNLSNLYMALMMVFAMAVIMVAVMWKMFTKKVVNIVLLVVFTGLFVASFFMGRADAFIGNDGFLRSMIPHHSRAILVCNGSNLTDQRIIKLCGEIDKSQQQEIDEMKQILKDY